MDNSNDPQLTPNAPENLPAALSPRELAARRANAKKCTGPRTNDGMAASRLNALKHGFFARDVVNPVLDGPARAEEFHSLLCALLEEFQPESASERILVDEVAACRSPYIQRPTENLLASMGHEDRRAGRIRKARKLRRSGLDAFILPSD